MNYKLDIFKLIDRLQRKDINFFSSLSEEEKKGFQPVVVQRWISGTNNSNQIIAINEFLNRYVFSLSKHPELLYYLMTVPFTGKHKRACKWIASKKISSSFPISEDVIRQTYGYNSKDALESMKLLSNEDILEMAEVLGFQSEQISKLKTEIKKR